MTQTFLRTSCCSTHDVVRRVAGTEFVQDQSERFISEISRQAKAPKPPPSPDTPMLTPGSALDPTSAQGPYVSLDSDAGSTDAALTEVAAKTMFRAREARLHSSMNGLAGLISPLGTQIAAPGVQLSAQNVCSWVRRSRRRPKRSQT